MTEVLGQSRPNTYPFNSLWKRRALSRRASNISSVRNNLNWICDRNLTVMIAFSSSCKKYYAAIEMVNNQERLSEYTQYKSTPRPSFVQNRHIIIIEFVKWRAKRPPPELSTAQKNKIFHELTYTAKSCYPEDDSLSLVHTSNISKRTRSIRKQSMISPLGLAKTEQHEFLFVLVLFRLCDYMTLGSMTIWCYDYNLMLILMTILMSQPWLYFFVLPFVLSLCFCLCLCMNQA